MNGRLRGPQTIIGPASVLVLLIGLLIFGTGSWDPLLWVDEYLTQAAVRRTWPELIDWIANRDPAPGPYYVVSKAWQLLTDGESRFWIRLPSIIALAGAVTVMASLVRRTTGAATAWLVAGVLLALPVMSRFAQEHRPYAFAVLSTVALVWLWRRSLERGASRWWSAGYGAAVVASGLAHLYTLCLVPVLILVACLRPAGDRGAAMARTALPAVSAGLVLLPHLMINLRHPTGSPTDGPITVSSLARLVHGLVPWPVALVLAVLIVLGIVAAVRQEAVRDSVVLALCWMIIPPLLLLGAKITVDLPATKVRYLVFVLPAVAWLSPIGLRWVARRSLPVAILVLVLVAVVERTRYATSVPRDFVYYRDDGGWRQRYRCRIAQALLLIFEVVDPSVPRPIPSSQLGAELDAAAPREVECTSTAGLRR